MEVKIKKIKILVIVFAIILFSILHFIFQDNSEKNYFLGLSYYLEEDYEKSLNCLKKINFYESNYYSSQFLLGKILFFQNDFKNAAKIFGKISRKSVEWYEARIWQIRALILDKNYSKAENYLNLFIKNGSSDWRIFFLFSQLANGNQDYEKQLKMLQISEIYLKESENVYFDLSKIWKEFSVEEKSKYYEEKALKIGEGL